MINNLGKFNNISALEQIIAGVMPYDSNVEFHGIRKTKEVLWLQNGTNHYFSDLPIQYIDLVKEKYLQSPKAIEFLSKVTSSFPRQLELFTYYMWGDLDTTPDICNGKLSESENFRDKVNCPSLLWNCKKITIDGYQLNEREIYIVDMISDDMPDKEIARSLGISHSYLNDIKASLFRKVGVQTKVAFLKKAIQQLVII